LRNTSEQQQIKQVKYVTLGCTYGGRSYSYMKRDTCIINRLGDKRRLPRLFNACFEEYLSYYFPRINSMFDWVNVNQNTLVYVELLWRQQSVDERNVLKLSGAY
jgi:hypothetical protein